MPYEEDAQGQWWYVSRNRNYRARAYPRECLACGSRFYSRPRDKFRFCSRSCSSSGEFSAQWKGGRYLQKGYVLVRLLDDDHVAASMRDRQGRIPEHRLFMAEALGRPLSSHETIHHLNGDKTDNRLENLELRSGPHGKGARFRCVDCGSVNIEATRLGKQPDN
jgi:hypothetical protein